MQNSVLCTISYIEIKIEYFKLFESLPLVWFRTKHNTTLIFATWIRYHYTYKNLKKSFLFPEQTKVNVLIARLGVFPRTFREI